jgi:hypothetical protein
VKRKPRSLCEPNERLRHKTPRRKDVRRHCWSARRLWSRQTYRPESVRFWVWRPNRDGKYQVAVVALPFAYGAAFLLVCLSPFWGIDRFLVTQLNGYVFT